MLETETKSGRPQYWATYEGYGDVPYRLTTCAESLIEDWRDQQQELGDGFLKHQAEQAKMVLKNPDKQDIPNSVITQLHKVINKYHSSLISAKDAAAAPSKVDSGRSTVPSAALRRSSRIPKPSNKNQ